MKIFNALTGALLGTSLGMAAFIPMAYAERGYWGFGGEWILIALCGAIGWLKKLNESEVKNKNE